MTVLCCGGRNRLDCEAAEARIAFLDLPDLLRSRSSLSCCSLAHSRWPVRKTTTRSGATELLSPSLLTNLLPSPRLLYALRGPQIVSGLPPRIAAASATGIPL